MAEENIRRVVKRIKKVNKHHGGSWKIAYADFVTAMMAFFLLMWLLSLLNKYQVQGVAEYFKKPLKEIFVKQDNILQKNTYKPDKVGPTVYKNEGTKEKSDKAIDVNQGSQDKPENSEGKSLSSAIAHEQDLAKQQPKQASASAKEEAEEKKDKAAKEKQAEKERQTQQIQNMAVKMADDLKTNQRLSEYKNALNFSITADGLKIELRDLENKPMFSQGKVDFQKYAAPILSWLSAEMNQYPNRVVIIGHTDSLPYSSGNGNYSNWELSTDRANATRRELIKYGMDPRKIMRIMGDADVNPANKQDGSDPSNRRIVIMILNEEAAQRYQQQ